MLQCPTVLTSEGVREKGMRRPLAEVEGRKEARSGRYEVVAGNCLGERV